VSVGSRVLITAKSVSGHAPALQVLRDAGCEVVLASNAAPFDEALLAAQVPGFDAIVYTLEPTTRRVIDAARELRIVARPGVGYDTVDIKACTERRIPVTISPVNDQSVADFALGLMLDVARGITTAVNSVQAHGWERVTGRELWQKTLAVVGLGRIGKGVAQRARGFDMRVLAVDDYHDAEFAARHGVEYVSLDAALRAADFISLHAPLTAATEALINAERLASMKRGAFLINTARGGLLDEAAVVAAVNSGQLGGAAVDVLRQQGANSPSPLIGVPGILVTPHMATFSVESMQRVAMSVAGNIVTALAGRRPDGVVNPEIYA
jgi:phosphoglycerate dehydrogenase-like enzyme